MTDNHFPPTGAALFYNSQRPRARELMLEAARLIHEAGVRALLTTDETAPLPSYIRRLPLAEAMAQAGLAVVIGGDGTMLRVAAHAAEAGVPLLGVNMGRLGFMSELEPEELYLLPRVLAGQCRADRRMMLSAALGREGAELPCGHVLNDVVISRGPGDRMLDLDVWSDTEQVCHLRADGVIIATPTGSTAYSLAAGGPIVETAAENIIITPVCAHGLYAKSFVLAPGRLVRVNVGRQAILSLDGKEGMPLLAGDEVRICRSPHSTTLLRIKGKSVYDIIRNKLTYPAAPAAGAALAAPKKERNSL